MSESLALRIVEGERTAFDGFLTGPLELGRQRTTEPAPYSCLPATAATPARLIVAHPNERDNVSRDHALLEPLPSGRVRVTNRSGAALLCAAVPGGAIVAKAAVELSPPFTLSLPGRSIIVTVADSADPVGIHSLDDRTVAPGRLLDLSRRFQSLSAITAPQLGEMVGWLQTTMGVLQATVGAADFLDKATEALVQIVGLDLGRVLLLDGEQWNVAASHGTVAEKAGPWQPSRHVLARACDNRKTFWQSPRQAGPSDTPSLEPLQMVVAAPILDAAGNVIGALYGERRRAASPLRLGGKLEAVLVELLACGVATGLARQAQEKAAVEAQVRFEQFFGPDLARELAREPALLEPRDAGVTVLFCDVRGFSRLTEQLGPAQTLRWMYDVLSELSDRVLQERGVLVDYVGDELMAMWGAPQDQSDQAARAVRAGLAMLDALPALNQRWQEVLGGPAQVGIGINSGPAQVGNIGSKVKFKYGPRGDTVNRASRVQGLTKYLKRPLLVTRATREQLGDNFLARRIVKARVVNIEGPVDLYEVAAADSEQRRQFFTESEEALEALETGDFVHAVRRAGALLLDHRDDAPLLLILSRASGALMQDGQGFDPVWPAPGK